MARGSKKQQEVPAMPVPEMVPAPVESASLVEETKVEAAAIAPVKTGPIVVVAKTKGWYANQRRSAGDTFKIKSEKDLGSWMEKI